MFLMLQLNMFKPPVAAYMSSPCHIELILSEKEEPVKKEVCGSLYTVCVPSIRYIRYCCANLADLFDLQAESQIATRKA